MSRQKPAVKYNIPGKLELSGEGLEGILAVVVITTLRSALAIAVLIVGGSAAPKLVEAVIQAL
jgi:hypothetical protein